MGYSDAHYAGYNDVWYTCDDCGAKYRATERTQHLAKHISRPHEDWLTLEETAVVLGLTKGELNHDVRTKRIAVERRPPARRVWVSTAAIKFYAEREMKHKGIAVMERLTQMRGQ